MIQISANGVGRLEPVRTLLRIRDEMRDITEPSLEAESTVDIIERTIGMYAVWAIDTRGNIMPNGLVQEEKDNILQHASGCLVEHAPLFWGEYNRLAQWQAKRSIFIGHNIFNIDRPAAQFSFEDSVVRNNLTSASTLAHIV